MTNETKVNKNYHKEYYLKNKENIKENSRKQYLKNKGVNKVSTEIKVVFKRGNFIVEFD